MSIDPSLIQGIGDDLQGIGFGAARAKEIAAELDALLAGLDRVLPAVGFFDDPDGFRGVLWQLRDRSGESAGER